MHNIEDAKFIQMNYVLIFFFSVINHSFALYNLVYVLISG